MKWLRSSVGCLAATATMLTGMLALGGTAAADTIRGADRVCFDAIGGSATIAPGDVAVVNLTPVLGSSSGFGSLISSDQTDNPEISNVNYEPGSIDPNVAFSEIGTDGNVCYSNGAGSNVHVVADQIGAVDAAAFRSPSTDGRPVRVLDTRAGLGGSALAAGEQRCFGVAGDIGDAAIVNLTPVRASGPGFGTLVSTGPVGASDASNVNYGRGRIDPNLALAPIGDGGEICFDNGPTASVDLVVDHVGNLAGTVYEPAQTGGAPSRLLDTRTTGGSIGASERLCVSVPVGDAGDVAVVNLTPLRASARGYGTTSESSSSAPLGASVVNYDVGSVDPNVSLVPIGSDGNVCFDNGPTATVDLVIDLLGVIDADVFEPAAGDGRPVRRLDTRTTASVLDLVATSNSIGLQRFGTEPDTVVDYVQSALGSPVSDRTVEFSTRLNPDSHDPMWGNDDLQLGFSRRVGRETCFGSELCLYFGGDTTGSLRFVGYDQGESPGPSIVTPSGISLGSWWSDHLGEMTVNPGGCYSIGSGYSTSGVQLVLRSNGPNFPGADPNVTELPPPSVVSVISLHAGDQFFSLEYDC